MLRVKKTASYLRSKAELGVFPTRFEYKAENNSLLCKYKRNEA